MDFGYLRRVEKGQGASVRTYARLAEVLGLRLGDVLASGGGAALNDKGPRQSSQKRASNVLDHAPTVTDPRS